MRPRRFVWMWALLVLVMVALLAFVLLQNSAAAEDSVRDDETAIRALVKTMETAVIEQDAGTYLGCVDLSDPIFASEHRYWVNDWAEGDPLAQFVMQVDHIAVSGDGATAALSMMWAVQPLVSYRAAMFPVRFVRGSTSGWLYAGEAWVTLETDHFQVNVFPGMDSTAETVVGMLPAIYDHATGSLGYVPGSAMSIKLYDSQDALGATIALRLPPIRGWNEPGESLKLYVEPPEIPSRSVLAHEMTHFLTFDMAGTTHGLYPWWLAEGIAQLVASDYWEPDQAASQLNIVREWQRRGMLADWDAISDYETTPVALWGFVYPQGYAFARYVTDTFGAETRNEWLRAMARDMAIDAASQHVLGSSFAALDGRFQAWLRQTVPESS